MRKWSGTLLIVIFGGLLWLQTVLVLPKQLDDQSNVEIYDRPHGKDSYDQLARGLHLVEVKGSEREWELWADQADKKAGFQDWDLTTVEAKFFGKDSLRYSVHGEHGAVTETQQDMEIVGNVSTTSSEGYRFEASSLHYDSMERMLKSPGEVVIFGPKDPATSQFTMWGTGLRAYVDESLIVLEDKVRAVVHEEDGQTVRISSQSATLRGDPRTGTFEGQVVIRYRDMVIRGPLATFYFDGQGSTGLTKVVIDKGVKLRDKVRSGESRRLTLFVPEERAEMEGNPRVKQGTDVLQGDRIVFLDGGQRVQVLKARAKVKNIEEGK